MDSKLLYKISVKGNVQGVGFRWSAAREARNLGITGYVRNQSDGSVCLEAEGYHENLEAFVEWCRKGPAYGYVDSVEIVSLPVRNYTEFRIEH